MARPRIPDEAKKARGTLQPCRSRDGEMQGAVLLTECKPPSHLRGNAKRYFASTARTLICWGLLTEADIPALTIYAQALAEIEECNEAISRNGKFNTVYDDSGKVVSFVANPYIKLREQDIDTVMRISKEYGLTAMSRKQLASAVQKPKASDGFEEFEEL